MDLLLQNCHIIDPLQNIDAEGIDIEISKGIITRIGKSLDSDFLQKDLHGAVVAPGFFDMHVHLREPGQEYKETVQTGTAAAAAGGFTGICCMPNTTPSISDPFVVSYIRDKAKNNIVDVEICATMTQGRSGKGLSPMQALADAGIKMVSDDGSAVENAETMRRVFEYAKMFDFLCTQHCEEHSMTSGTCMHEGEVSTKLGLPGYPSVAEDIIIARDILLAEYIGDVRYHAAHISTKGAVELIRQAKAKGLPVSCEVTPHHFTLTDKEVEIHWAQAKMNPPLREEEDIKAILAGLSDGTIDCISTDHAPHATHEKETDMLSAAYGIIGLESAIGLGLTQLVHAGILTISQYIQKCSVNPRALLKLPTITIKEGEKANLTIINPNSEWSFDLSAVRSKSQNTPFLGKRLKGKPLGVINNNMIYWN